MTIHELKTGNIIIDRSGYAGIVIKELDRIVYQEHEQIWLNEFDEDLTYFDEEFGPNDIMEVYSEGDFFEYYLYDCLYQRDPDWVRPTEEERRACEEEAAKKWQEMMESMKEQYEKERVNCISVIAQQFYGNRTGTEVNRDEIGYFLRGCLSREVYKFEDLSDMDRRIVHVPGAEHIVIVYDQTQEDEYVNVGFPEMLARDADLYRESFGEELTMRATCEIPEIGFKIHTRCIACRMDENGILQSLEDDDYKQFIHYFPER